MTGMKVVVYGRIEDSTVFKREKVQNKEKENLGKTQREVGGRNV